MGAGIQKHPRFRVSFPIGLVTPSGDVEEFQLEDISLGGAFVRTLLPAPAGTFVRMRLPLEDGDLSLMGRVVHVINDDDARTKARQRGMGVQFDGLAPDTEKRLARFVGGLVEQERRRRDHDSQPRFLGEDRVHVPADRATLARLWTAGLERGLLTALLRTVRVRGGQRVAVLIGPLRFAADVVVVDVEAAGLKLVDLKGPARSAIAAFISGESKEIEASHVGASAATSATTSAATSATTSATAPTTNSNASGLSGAARRRSDSAEALAAHVAQSATGHGDVDIRPVLAEARRLLAHLETDDLYGALGVDPGATDDELLRRVRALSAQCTIARTHATPPQRARLEHAIRELLALEGTLCGPPVVVGALIEETVRAQVEELVAEADFLANAGQPREAQQALLEAQEIAPESSGVHRRLVSLGECLLATGPASTAKVSDEQAQAILDTAEQLRRDDLIARVRAVNHVSTSRTVLLRAMRMLASAGAHDDMLAVAQHLVDLDDTDELPLFAMMQVNERLERFPAALRAGEALLRLRPDDYSLQDRVAALAEIARRL